MTSTRYARVLLNPRTRALLLLGFLIRVPMFGVGVLITVHVTSTLHRSWSDAGLVASAATLALAISGPWRGKLLDTLGLRRVVLPSIFVTAGCWAIAPFSSYWILLVLASVSGLFAVPTFTVIRQALMAATEDEDRRIALSVDGIVVEFSFMLGPTLAIALATVFSTSWVIFSLEMVSAVIALALWWLNPPIRSAIDEEESNDVRIPRRSWVTGRFLAVCLVGFAAVIVLSGSDVSFVAAAKSFHASSQLGYGLTIWALGSVIGGVIYGWMSKPPPLFVLLFMLALLTVPLGLAQNIWQLAGLGFIAGVFCAPTMTASVEAVSRVVPEQVRGEALGWQGSFLTLGGALGGPIAGWFIDKHGYAGGFASVGVTGAAMAVVGWFLVKARRAHRSRRAVPR